MARFKFVALAPLIAVFLVVGLLWLVRTGATPEPTPPVAGQRQTVALPTATALAAPTPTPEPVAATSPEISASAETLAADNASAEPRTPDAVAIVNGVVLAPAGFEQLLAIDAVMAGLANETSSPPAAILEQWANGELVWQRAAEGGLPAIDADGTLDDFLVRVGRRRTELDDALAAAQVSPTVFADYWRRLVTVQQFAQEQAAAQQVDAGAYIQRLQQEARISFGPAAGALLAAPTPAQPVAAAATTTEPEPAVAPATTAATETTAEIASTEPPAEQRGVEVGMLAPEFVLATMADDVPLLALSDLRGRPTVLSFWTTWCPYCLRQTPVMVAAYARVADAGIQFVGIDVQEDRNTVEPYLAQHQIEYPILLDEQGATAAQYAVQGYPTTYFLDSNSRVVARNIGALTEDQLNTYLQMLSPPGQGP